MDSTREIPLTQGKVAIVDACDFEWVSQWPWQYHVCRTKEYACRSLWDPQTKTTRRLYMHRAILDCQPGEESDHWDGDGLNNRRGNLRKCTHQQNQCNQRKCRLATTSIYKGVSWYPRYAAWRAIVGDKFLGYFDSEIDGARAYNEAASEMFGVFARLNDLQEGP